MTISPSVRLDRALRLLGIPIDGVAFFRSGTFRVDFRPEATAAQRGQALDLASTFSVKNYRPKPRVLLEGWFDGLTAAQRQLLFRGLVVERLRSDPEFSGLADPAFDPTEEVP